MTHRLGRPPRPEDAVGLLCSPWQEELPADGNQQETFLETASRNSSTFCRMVKYSISRAARKSWRGSGKALQQQQFYQFKS